MLDWKKCALMIAFLTFTLSQENYDSTKAKQSKQASHNVSNGNGEERAMKPAKFDAIRSKLEHRQPLYRRSQNESTKYNDIGKIRNIKQIAHKASNESVDEKTSSPEIFDALKSRRKHHHKVPHYYNSKFPRYYGITKMKYSASTESESASTEDISPHDVLHLKHKNRQLITRYSNENNVSSHTEPEKLNYKIITEQASHESVEKHRSVGYYISQYRTPTGHDGGIGKHQFVPGSETSRPYRPTKTLLKVDKNLYDSLEIKSSTTDGRIKTVESSTISSKTYYTRQLIQPNGQKYSITEDYRYDPLVIRSLMPSGGVKVSKPLIQPIYEETIQPQYDQLLSKLIKSQFDKQPIQHEYGQLKSTLTVDDNRYYSLIIKSSTTESQLDKQPIRPEYGQLKSTLTVDDNRYYSLIIKSSTTESQFAKQPIQPEYEKLKSTLTVDDNRYYSLIIKSSTTESQFAKQPIQPEYEKLKSTLIVDDNRHYSRVTKSSTTDSQFEFTKQPIQPQPEPLKSTLSVDNNRYYSLLIKSTTDGGVHFNAPTIQPLNEKEKSILTTGDNRHYSLNIQSSTDGGITVTQPPPQPVYGQEKLSSTISDNESDQLALKYLKMNRGIDCKKSPNQPRCAKKESIKPPCEKTTKNCQYGSLGTTNCRIECYTPATKPSCEEKKTTANCDWYDVLEKKSTKNTWDGTWYDFLGVTSKNQNRPLSPDMVSLIKDADPDGDLKDCMIDFIDCLCARNMEHIEMYRLCAISYRTGVKRAFNSICELHYENCKRNDNWVYEGDIDCETSNPQQPLDIESLAAYRRSLCLP